MADRLTEMYAWMDGYSGRTVPPQLLAIPNLGRAWARGLRTRALDPMPQVKVMVPGHVVEASIREQVRALLKPEAQPEGVAP